MPYQHKFLNDNEKQITISLWIKLHSIGLPSSHLSPPHGCLHEQAKVSFSWSKMQEPLFKHPFIRQPCRKRKNKYPSDMILQPEHLAFYLSFREFKFSQRSFIYGKEKRKSFSWGLKIKLDMLIPDTFFFAEIFYLRKRAEKIFQLRIENYT